LRVELEHLQGDGAVGFDLRSVAATVDGFSFSSGSPTFTINFVDNDGVRFSPAVLAVTEGDTTGTTYGARLRSNPGDGITVTVTPAAPAGLTVMPASLTFTGGASGTWNTAQNFTVTAGEDANGVSETHIITHAVSAESGAYSTITTPSVSASPSPTTTPAA